MLVPGLLLVPCLLLVPGPPLILNMMLVPGLLLVPCPLLVPRPLMVPCPLLFPLHCWFLVCCCCLCLLILLPALKFKALKSLVVKKNMHSRRSTEEWCLNDTLRIFRLIFRGFSFTNIHQCYAKLIQKFKKHVFSII